MLACDTIPLTYPKSGLLTQHYKEITQQSPDPFPCERAESGHETMCKHICVSNLEMAITATATPFVGHSEHLWATLNNYGLPLIVPLSSIRMTQFRGTAVQLS